MGKLRRKSKSEAEHARGVIRELEKENKALKRQLKHLEKKEHIFDAQDEEIAGDCEDTMVELKRRIRCTECFKGTYDEFEILDKVFATCNVCQHRTKL